MSDLAKALYQVFDPAPLSTEDKDLYVNLDAVRGSMDLVERLATSIRFSETPTCQTVTGHHGSGKSTELRRLQQELETGDPGLFGVFVEARRDIDPNDVDFPEVLTAVVRQMAEQLKEREGITLAPAYFEDRLERLKRLFLSEVEFDKIELSAAFAKLSSVIKSSPDARQEIRKLLDPDTDNWIDAANEVIGKAKLELKKRGYHDLVVIVDDLDKIVLRTIPDAGCTMGEYLFVNRVAQLQAFQCHMVYTMPLALAYSAQERVIASLYGGSPPVVPMTKLRTMAGKGHAPGRKGFQKIIEQRLKRENAAQAGVFENTRMRDRLIQLSGGQPRELMILIREAIVSDGLPIAASAVRRVQHEANRAYVRILRKAHWDVINEIRGDPLFCRTDETDAVFRDLLDSRAILQYVNDEEWYGVNPLVPDPPASLNNG